MYTLNQYDSEYRIAIKEDNRLFKFVCTLDSQEIPNDSYTGFSLEYDLINGSEEYTIGNLAATKLNITFSSDIPVQEGSVIKLDAYLEVIDQVTTNKEWAHVPLGIYTVHTITEKKISNIIVAYDAFYNESLCREYDSRLKYDSTSKTISIKSILDELSTRYLNGLQFYDNELYEMQLPRPLIVTEKILLDNGKYEVVETDSMKACLSFTVGQTLGYIASYLGGNFIIDGTNTVKLIKYPETAKFSYPNNKYNINSSGKVEYKINRIDCSTYEGNIISVGVDSEDSALVIENPFIYKPRLEELLNEITTISYNPVNFKVMGDPTTQLGDVVRLEPYNGGNAVTTPIIRMTMRFSGGVVTDMESVCKAIQDKTIEYKGTLTQKVESLSSTVSSVGSDLERINDSINKLLTVKEYVDQMNEYINTLPSEVNYSRKVQYELLLDKILKADAEFDSRYTAVISNKYLV